MPGITQHLIRTLAPGPAEIRFDPQTNEIQGFIAIWGSPVERDAYGTWFDEELPPELGLDFLPIPLLYEHTYDEGVRKEIIGEVVTIWWNETGIAFRGNLFDSADAFSRIRKEIADGVLATSSASSPHLVDFDEMDRFRVWILSELSLTAYPAEERMPLVTFVTTERSCYLSLCSDSQRGCRTDIELSDATNLLTGRSNKGSKMNRKLVRKFLRSLTSSPGLTAELRASLGEMLGEDFKEATAEDILAALVSEYGVESIMGMMSEIATPAEPTDPALSNTDTDDVAEPPEPVELAGEERSLGAIMNMFATLMSEQRSLRAQMGRFQAQEEDDESAPPDDADPVNRSTSPMPQHLQLSSKYDRLTAAEMAYGYSILRSAQPKHLRKTEPAASETYLKAMAYKLAQQMESGDAAANDFSVVRSFPFRSKNDVMSSDVTQAVRRQMESIRAGEIHDGTDGEGLDWIDTYQGTSLWESVRAETNIYARALGLGMEEHELPQGFNGEQFKLEGSDPTWYVSTGAVDYTNSVPQATFSSSKLGTEETNVSVAKLSVMMTFQKEVEEDSMIPMLPEAHRKIRVSSAEQIEYILLNGDTATAENTNINLIDGTPATAPAKPSYTLLNGFLKLALVTTGSNSRDAETTLTESDYLNLLPLLGVNGILAGDLTKLMYVIDNPTYFASLNIALLKSHDVFRNATIEDGVLTRIWGIELNHSNQLGLANASGLISGTPSNNTRGRISLIRPDQWISVWKRRIQTDVTYFAFQDVTQVTAHMRWGVQNRDPESVALSYNVNTAIT